MPTLNPLLSALGAYPAEALHAEKRALLAAGREVFDFSVGDPLEPTDPRIVSALRPAGPPSRQDLWAELPRSPCGSPITQAAPADRGGRPRAHRAVGSANGANPIAIVVPCHRVVATGGGLGGYAYGTDTKRRLLDLERVTASLL